MVNHPNAAGVLVLGLGCENNNIAEFQKVLGSWNPKRVSFLNAQECEDEIEEGRATCPPVAAVSRTLFSECRVPVSKLKLDLNAAAAMVSAESPPIRWWAHCRTG
ncbi:MAG: UxaA family hydrolase [Clostridia bacterium]